MSTKGVANLISLVVYLVVAAAIIILAIIAIDSQRNAIARSSSDLRDVRASLDAETAHLDAVDRHLDAATRRLGDLVRQASAERRELGGLRRGLDHMVVHVHLHERGGCCGGN
jgi:Tfp pilus assembly protein PilE